MGAGRRPLRRAAAVPVLALALLAGGGRAAGAGDEPGPDAALLRRIADLRERASRIRVDGRAGDWKGIPSFEDADPAAKTSIDRSLDIARVSVAPREGDVLVLIETAGAPSRLPAAFGLDIDFLGTSAFDASLRFGAEGGAEITARPEEGQPVAAPLARLEVAVGEAVEVRVPLAMVAAALGLDGTEWLSGNRRPFVRVQPFTALPGSRARIDDGPAAASFVLGAPPLALDPPLRQDGAPRRAVRLPLQGKWFVRQGDHGVWTHQDLWAYDLAVEDQALRPCPVAGSRRDEDYYSWERPVVAPEAGTVVFDSAPAEDRPPLEAEAGKGLGNTLIVRFEDGLRLSFGHLRKGSRAFPRGAAFPAGAVLAKVGNSGDSRAPHLHLSLHERPGEFVGLPLALRDVRVGLNPGPDDPWARDLPSWTIREGWFVEGR